MKRSTSAPILRLLLLLPALLPIVAGCGSASSARRADSDRQGGSIVEDSTRSAILEIMRRVEREPLAAEAPDLRTQAFTWVVSTPDLKGFDIDASYVEPLDKGVYPFKGEMMMQFVFGMVLWRYSPEAAAGGNVAKIEAGLRSMIAAYRNIVLMDRNLKDPWLERLDELRRLGRLRAYVEEIEAARQ
jgi:hypothetical protein